jgi:hypothetical protein
LQTGISTASVGAGCKRKFDVAGYIKLIGEMVDKIKAQAGR